jgi:uncharacterized protein
MVTRSQPGLDVDVEIFRTVARHHRGHFGVWAGVLTAGNLSLRDSASIAASTPSASA